MDKLREWEDRWNNGDVKFVKELFELVEQQQMEIDNLQYSCRLKQMHINNIPKIREEYEVKLQQANTRIQFLEGLRSAKA